MGNEIPEILEVIGIFQLGYMHLIFECNFDQHFSSLINYCGKSNSQILIILQGNQCLDIYEIGFNYFIDMGNIWKKEEKTHNHPRLLSSKTYNMKNKEYIKTRIPFVSREQFDNWEKKINCQPANHQNTFLPKSQQKDSSKVLNLSLAIENLHCGQFYWAEVLYPPHWLLLEDQLRRIRKLEKGDPEKNIQEVKIWELLNNLVQLAESYHRTGKKVGDIRPANILISGQGTLKIFTQDSWPNQTTNYLKTASGKAITYLAPQEQHDAIIGYTEQSTPFDAGQAFSIGLTCLQAILACLGNNTVEDIYEIKQQLNVKILQTRIKQVLEQRIYSASLLTPILCLIQTDINKRITPCQLAPWLKNGMMHLKSVQPKIAMDAPELLMTKFTKLHQHQDNQQLIYDKTKKKYDLQVEEQDKKIEVLEEFGQQKCIIGKQEEKSQYFKYQPDRQPTIQRRQSNPSKAPQRKRRHKIRSKNLLSFD